MHTLNINSLLSQPVTCLECFLSEMSMPALLWCFVGDLPSLLMFSSEFGCGHKFKLVCFDGLFCFPIFPSFPPPTRNFEQRSKIITFRFSPLQTSNFSFFFFFLVLLISFVLFPFEIFSSKTSQLTGKGKELKRKTTDVTATTETKAIFQKKKKKKN